MPIITLTTDWGLRDHYLASFKGELMSRSPDIQLVDISHEIEHFDILQASFVIRNCFEKFPKGTLHFIGIAGNITEKNKNDQRNFLVVKSNGHYFIGEDSGIFSLILGETDKEIFRLPVAEERFGCSGTVFLRKIINQITKIEDFLILNYDSTGMGYC